MSQTSESFNLQIETQEEQIRDQSNRPDQGRAANLILLACSILQLPTWGFVISYGVLQEQYTTHLDLSGNKALTGIIGTTLNGCLYISLPIISTLLSTRFRAWRRTALLIGILMTSTSLVLSASSTAIWHLIVTQGILCGFGSALMFSPTTLYLDEWFIRKKSYAYGVNYAAKNIVGTGAPFLTPALLNKVGLQNTLRIWGAITFTTSILAIPFLKPRLPLVSVQEDVPETNPQRRSRCTRSIGWKFLSHPTFYIFNLANIIFSSGYGLPQTYLPTYASSILHLPASKAALMLVAFNFPGIASCVLFGMLGDGRPLFKRYSPSAFTTTAISALGSAVATFMLWGLAGGESTAGLAVFSATYGFFASAYSSTWASAIREIEQEAANHHEPIDTGVVYGLFNGGRGVGFVVGGLVGVELLKGGNVGKAFGFGSEYGWVIMYTGLSAVVGGWSCLWRSRRLVQKR